VTVVDQLGHLVASGSGNGTAIDWTWSSLVAGKGLFTWTISSPGARPATGTIGIGRPLPAPGPTLSLTNLATTPSVITPNADGSADVMTVSFTLGTPSLVTAQVLDESGAPMLTLVNEQRTAGNNSFEWAAHVLVDGRYRIVVTAKSGTKSITKTADVVVDRTLAGLQAMPMVISPNGDGVNDSTTLSFALAQNVPVRLDIYQAGVIVGSPFQGQLGIGPQTLVWNGAGFGAPLFDGTYQATITVTDQLGDVQLSVPITIDNTPPTLTLVDKATLTFTLNEPATVTLLVNQKTRIVLGEQKGTFRIPYSGGVYQVSAEAQDLAGNFSPVLYG
jgi:hypothetical protein